MGNQEELPQNKPVNFTFTDDGSKLPFKKVNESNWPKFYEPKMAWAMKRMSTQKAASDKEKPTDASIDEILKSQKLTVKDANDSDVVSMLGALSNITR